LARVVKREYFDLSNGEALASLAYKFLHSLLENPEPKDEILFVNLKIVIEPGEDGYFVAHCPSLKSCWSQGKTREEALKNVREAIDLYLEPSPSELITNKKREVVELTI
jgi:predicted RNase H-like HicB family nuclease